MAAEVHTPVPVQAHKMKPDIEIDEDGVTWLFVETQYGKYKANHAVMTAPPFSTVADPITRNLGFDPGTIDPSGVRWSSTIYSDMAFKPQPGPIRFDVL
ncbi:hypothetical protein HYP71_gp085 [Arthrobacter phage KBurrousTX]|uniref:Uncharacterized protein n=1 Tax=Arthrobacter phage KBurrousTX TaxID=2315608 RepID=A0A386K8I9_9CAUD|nr:hypothetical protein HYP71_gp085 [Arthrobacter phage KBurrousTX]AYD81579.1 hypothetical protein KBurrousTX_85 [Arthrobacter phage KBurrousTX]